MLRPGSKGFIVVLSLCMATTALGVDTILPAYPDIRAEFGLADDAAEVTGLITSYILGISLGLLPAGLLADRFGRRAIIWGGLALYVAGAIGSIMAPSLGVMFVARFVWGLGGAGPRVAAMAMVRDGFEGDEMARQMSLVMAVFLLVPAIGPSLSAGILAIGTWQAVIWMCAAVAVLVGLLVRRMPETLPTDMQRSLDARSVWTSCRIVMTSPGTVAYLVALTVLFGAFISYLSGSELILDQTYDLAEWFPAFFGVLALVMLAGMLLNGRLVGRLGLSRLLRRVFVWNGLAIGTMLVVAVLTAGEPPFWLFVVLISAVLLTHQMLIPNLTAAAMRSLAQVAGTAAAILNMVSGALGAVLAEVINRRFDGTIMPLTVGFAAATTIAVMAWRSAERATALPPTR